MYKQPIKDLLKQFVREAAVRTFIVFLIALVVGILCSVLSGCVGGARRPLIEADGGSWEPVDGSIPDGDLLADVPTDGWELFDGSGGEDAASTDSGAAGEADAGEEDAGDPGTDEDAGPGILDAGGLADSGAGPVDAGRVAPICPGVCNYNACTSPRTGWCWFYNAPDPAGWPDSTADGGLACGWLTSVVCGGACTSARGCL